MKKSKKSNDKKKIDELNQIEVLKDKKIVFFTNGELKSKLEYNYALDKYFDIFDFKKFIGKTLCKHYDFVVKVTNGLAHSIGHIINFEAKKVNAKLITTSHVNIDLLLNDIVLQL